MRTGEVGLGGVRLGKDRLGGDTTIRGGVTAWRAALTARASRSGDCGVSGTSRPETAQKEGRTCGSEGFAFTGEVEADSGRSESSASKSYALPCKAKSRQSDCMASTSDVLGIPGRDWSGSDLVDPETT